MKKVARVRPARVIKVSGERLQKLDARLRARELKRRAQGQLHPRLLVDPLDPRVKIIGPYKF